MARETSTWWVTFPGLLLCGMGTGSVFAPMSNATMSSVEPRLAGTASGIFNTARQVGGVFGSAATGVLLQARISAGMASSHGNAPVALTNAARETLILPIAVLLLGIVAAAAMHRPVPRRAPAQPDPAGARA
ncbi:MFS family permease [Amycolatopsis viridis]|uniref:MFS family permease n=1 Tax=Amycolatopsis viridis TaxID=185678 RepID=A0ABX0T3K9_9PSEU|nr:MFS family permease [Amycolatopsis viridis]